MTLQDASTRSREARRPRAREVVTPWLGYLAVVVPVIVLYAAGPLDGWWVFNLVGLSSAAAVVLGTHRHRPAGRLGFYLVALGLVLFVAGDFLTSNYPALLHRPLPFPSVADPVYLAVYPCLAFGLVAITRLRHPLRDRGALIDAHILGIGVGTLAWELLMDPYASDRALDNLSKLTSIAYPLSDVLLIGVLAWMMLRATWRGPSVHLIAASLAALLITDSLYGWVNLHSIYRPGGALDCGWLAFYALMGAAALHPSMARLSEAGPDRPPQLSSGRLALLTAAVLISPGAQLVCRILRQPVDGMLDVTTAVLFVLVLLRLAGFVRTQGKATENALRERYEARLAALVRHSSDVVSTVARDGLITYVSPSGARLFGRSPESLTAHSLIALVHPDDAAGVRGFLAGLEHGESGSLEFRVGRADDSWRYVQALATNLLEDETVAGIVLNMRDVTDREALERDLARQAFYDALTGLPNRSLFRDRVEQAILRHLREGARFAVVLLDLDDFRTVNDSLGHAIGDSVLREVAYRLHGCARRSDTIARLGGDEFAVLVEEIEDEREAIAVAERVVAALGRSILTEGLELHTTTSVGIVFDADGGDCADVLLRNAEVAMYAAKRRGAGPYAVFEDAMHREAVERLQVKADLKRAVDEGAVSLAYQPVVDLRRGEIVGLEAIARWERPGRGPVAPEEFMALADRMGLMHRLGPQLMRKLCADAAALLPLAACAPPLSVSVSMSAHHLRAPTFVETTRQALEETGLPARSLAIVLRGAAMMEDVPLFVGRIEELRALGVAIGASVLGTGDISLNNVRRFPIDVLALDRSFVEDVARRPDEAREMMVSILGFARVRGVTPVARGIDDAGQLETLRALGCALGQGRFLHPVLSVDGVAALLRGPVLDGVATVLEGAR